MGGAEDMSANMSLSAFEVIVLAMGAVIVLGVLGVYVSLWMEHKLEDKQNGGRNGE